MKVGLKRRHQIVLASCSKLRLGAETQNGYKWLDRPGSAVMGDQAEHRRSVGPGGKRKRADSECPVKLVSQCSMSSPPSFSPTDIRSAESRSSVLCLQPVLGLFNSAYTFIQ